VDASVIRSYLSYYEKAQEGKKEFSESEYKEVMKLLVMLLKGMGVYSNMGSGHTLEPSIHRNNLSSSSYTK